MPDKDEGVLLYVGADAQNVQSRRLNLTGRRCFSGAYGPKSRFTATEAAQVVGILDSGAFSGAFSDAPEARLDCAAALERQLRWEREAHRFWGYPWQAEALVSYDCLIDEKWHNGRRRKERWTVEDAERAVAITVDAAAYLSSQRYRLEPRKLVLACQGVDAQQYRECVEGVLQCAIPADWIGLGGWCILGWFRRWIPTFWATAWSVLPLIADAGVSRVHIFGVMFRPVLGGLLWLCDQHGLTLSTDSSGPVLQSCWKDRVRAGAYAATWEENTEICKESLRTLRQSQHYRRPPRVRPTRQLLLW
ncbi:MAG: hypothetical protein JO110_17195 [Acetobacteraceae bacterium]|nr:hypothetical protein [Acetobacteraceae bacterium]